MDVRHGQRRPDDPRQVRDISHLLQAFVQTDRGHQLFVGEDQAIDAHLALSRDTPPVRVYLFQFHRATSQTSKTTRVRQIPSAVCSIRRS